MGTRGGGWPFPGWPSLVPSAVQQRFLSCLTSPPSPPLVGTVRVGSACQSASVTQRTHATAGVFGRACPGRQRSGWPSRKTRATGGEAGGCTAADDRGIGAEEKKKRKRALLTGKGGSCPCHNALHTSNLVTCQRKGEWQTAPACKCCPRRRPWQQPRRQRQRRRRRRPPPPPRRPRQGKRPRHEQPPR